MGQVNTTPDTADPVVICDDPLYQCRCILPVGHDDDLHVCNPECGGSWRWLDAVTFQPASYPRGVMVEGLRVVERIASRDGQPFVEAGTRLSVPRGGITFLQPPSLGAS